MAQKYDAANDRITDLDDTPFSERSFGIVLVDPRRVTFAKDAKDVEKVVEEAGDELTHAELRVQIINDPTRPISSDAMILQFFLVDPNTFPLEKRRFVGVLYEDVDGTRTPLFLLNGDEVWHTAHGGGFNTMLYAAA